MYLFPHLDKGSWMVIFKCIELATRWIWGTTYNFLYNMTGEQNIQIYNVYNILFINNKIIKTME